MSTPYTTPQTSAEVPSLTGDPRRKFWLKVVWASLAGVFIPPLLGLGITILSMRSAFKKLSESGTSDPTSLASDISNSLDSMIIGGALSTLALLLLVVAQFRLRSFPKAAKNTAS
ncbi:hypothetical protein SAMN02745181_0309 [Rubritalea squalenifaciens DSM 18772]|uniref:MotA/TolQ/ExbB proton channel domain-containing protein n=1 Tax=Rubritalea squalenifaciens DSM 18772 TaxID=1123071 RepID=A0A1M6BUR4_9BACT|nr:hypothetical protein [Rubritalea squalenifaciens]SHI52238.1 hypothetical protein SAMN02745181_0309 [Rubritalea squalenifaciens DSM 18772]